MISVFDREENIVEKQEKATSTRLIKVEIVW